MILIWWLGKALGSEYTLIVSKGSEMGNWDIYGKLFSLLTGNDVWERSWEGSLELESGGLAGQTVELGLCPVDRNKPLSGCLPPHLCLSPLSEWDFPVYSVEMMISGFCFSLC